MRATLMKNWIISFALASAASAAAVPAFAGQPPAHRLIPWGQARGQMQLLEAPDGRYGPEALAACGSRVLLLDAVGGAIVEMDRELREVGRFPVAPGGTGLGTAADCDAVAILYSREVHVHDRSGKRIARRSLPEELRFVTGLSLAAGGDVLLEERAARTFRLGAPPAGTSPAAADELDAVDAGLRVGRSVLSVEVVSGAAFRVIDHGAATTAAEDRGRREIAVGRDDLFSARLVGIDAQERVVVDQSFLVGQAPVVVERRVAAFDAAGNVAWSVALPAARHALSSRDVAVAGGGQELVAMVAAPDGLHLLRWALPAAGDAPAELRLPRSLPLTFAAPRGLPDPDFSAPLGAVAPQAELVTRDEMLAIADDYVRRSWYASSCNIGSGSCSGVDVVTPSWVTVGSHAGLPYKWGGFSTVDEFVDGIAACAFAGDKTTTGWGGSCAVGVDCSGFVSRCWKTTTKYGTSTLEQISDVISASAMAAGDVYNKASSHVRMLVARNSDGTLDMVESYAGSNAWRVDYTVRTIGDNSGYTPRRYFYVTGDTGVKPGTADNPIEIVGTELTDNNSTADSAEELIDSYGCAPGTNESGPEVYYSLALEATSTVTVTVSDGYGVDVDPHLLSGLEPASCIARNDVSFTVDKVYPGDYYIVADTWVNGSGDVLDGDYELTVEIAANGRSRVVVLNGGVRTAAAPPPPAR